MKIQHRQGDLLFTKVEGLPMTGYSRVADDGVIARGEISNHKHQLQGGSVYRRNSLEKDTRFDNTDLPIGYCVIPNGVAQVIHDEHETVDLEQGYWEVRRQREFVEGKKRQKAQVQVTFD